MKQDKTTTEEVAAAGEHPPQPDGPAPSARPAWLPRPLTLILAGLALVLAALMGVFLLTAERPVSGVALTASGTPQVGGPFELVDHTGKTVTEADFAGGYMLVYFGFTYCPDICPTALQGMARALDSLGPQGDKVRPVFITVDPERDTPENMAAYVNHFHERMVGLTGTPEQVREAAKAYKVFYKKVQGSGDADYVMDHTSVVYLMGPDGKFAGHFNHTTSPEEMAEGIAQALEQSSR
jgi:cytochrome oxidase Cu insertion factor (SCO1/SenC/PrrC family)